MPLYSRGIRSLFDLGITTITKTVHISGKYDNYNIKLCIYVNKSKVFLDSCFDISAAVKL